jgi:transcription termination/antitermination protein NusG
VSEETPPVPAGEPRESEGDASAPEAGAPEAAAPAAAPETPSAPKAAAPAEKRWYIVHTYSGHEQKAKQGLLEHARLKGKEELFDEILIPEEQVVEVVKGEKRTSKRKFFPGYILVRMVLNDETWHIVRGTARITGFVGGGGNKPTPISDEEVARMTAQIKEGAVKPKPKIKFEEGENVRVVSGPFANFQGFVDEVRPDKEKVRVMVQVFGRATPVELDYTQLEKA